MYIKSLTIQGFKSYRDQTVVDPFSPGVNVIVGRNGSGKSNFFSAIRFVLSDAYTSLSRADRQALLHEGTSNTSTFSAYVELVFDNSDNRFPTGKDEVLLRRTIGAKKDEYSLDRKSTGKGEVMSLLESAGFSRSNPYYIVPQGRITHLTNQKDPERLDLLKEVAGTRVYEDRRTESMKIIQETDAKREKIDELLEYIDARLQELEEEKAELKEYQTKDRERRCLEYQIYSRELDEVAETLQQLEDERASDAHTASERQEEHQKRSKEIGRLEAQLSAIRQEVEILSLEKTEQTEDRAEAIRAKTQVGCTITDIENNHQSVAESRASLNKELERVERHITDAESEFMTINPELQDLIKEERNLRDSIAEKSAVQEALYAKQGRSAQFSTEDQRNAYLDNQANGLRQNLKAREDFEQSISRDLEKVRTALTSTTSRQSELRAETETREELIGQHAEEVQSLKAKQADLSEQRKELWKEDAKLGKNKQHEHTELTEAERQLSTMMDKATSTGLRAVKRIAANLNLNGYYGPLYELFTVSEAYKVAAETTAGNSLFHVVVDTEETASKILEVLTRERAGRVTFMPLNRLRTQPVQYPTGTDAAIPLISRLQLKNRERDIKAFEQIFGKTLVCEDLAIGSGFVRSHKLNVITPEGDKIDRKGALTGGYHDVRKSRLDCIERIQTWGQKLSTTSRRYTEVQRSISEIEQAVTQLVGKIQIAQNKYTQTKDGQNPTASQLLQLQREEEMQQQRYERYQTSKSEVEIEIRQLKAQLSAVESERQTPMTNTLSTSEQKILTEFTAELDKLNAERVDASTARAKVQERKAALDIKLTETFRRRRDQLKSRLFASDDLEDVSNSTSNLSARKKELGSLEARINDLTAKLKETEDSLDKLEAKLGNLKRELEQMHNLQTENSRTLARQQKGVERFHAKRQMLLSRKEECNNNIRELGVLPEEAFEKTNVKAEKLVKQLHKVHEALKKFAHVNKKAIEQYNNFTKQREELLERQEELSNSHEAIEELIESLDQRKDEAIERTFQQVSKNFSEVFEKLVPAGRGRLIIQKRTDARDSDDNEDEDERAPNIDNYTGVSIKVSFNSKTDEGLKIQQLSGGQKSLVALAIVFAIQKCDPAPFYLFDEIDANLDADRRTAIASMISELSEGAQFIVTTFRSELLAHADSHFGVIFDARKVSSIRPIKESEAREFVEANERTGPEPPKSVTNGIH